MTARPEIRSSETVYAGRRIHVRVDRLVTAAGAEVVREVVEHPGAVVIVPVLPDRRVVLVRQYRHPVGRTLLELPAGNLREENFDLGRVWAESSLFHALRDRAGYGGACGVCEYRDLCGGCRARAFHDAGDCLASEPNCLHMPKRTDP